MKKTDPRRRALMLSIIEAAGARLPELPAARADLLEALSLIHPDKAAREQLHFTAFAIRKSEDAQMKLSEIFK